MKEMTMFKRIWSFVLVVCMVAGMLPGMTLTAKAETTAATSDAVTVAAKTVQNVAKMMAYAEQMMDGNKPPYTREDKNGNSTEVNDFTGGLFSWDTEKKTDSWRYFNGVMMDAFLMLNNDLTDYSAFKSYVTKFYNDNMGTDSTGKPAGYIQYELDSVECARGLFDLLATATTADKDKYVDAIQYVFKELSAQKAYANFGGNYQHKTTGGTTQNKDGWDDYNIALDGLYMAQPFLMECAKAVDDKTLTLDGVTSGDAIRTAVYNRFQWIATNMQDATTGLYYHGVDVPDNGAAGGTYNGHFWTRGIGWYAAALVDVIELMPANDPRRDEMIGYLDKLMKGVLPYQDKTTGMWRNVPNAGDITVTGIDGNVNRLETSGTALLAYALLKAYNLKLGANYETYGTAGMKAFNGTVDKKVTGTRGSYSVTDILKSSGVSGDDVSYCVARDKTDKTTIVGHNYVSDEAKGTGPLIMAAAEAYKALNTLAAAASTDTTTPAFSMTKGFVTLPVTAATTSSASTTLATTDTLTEAAVRENRPAAETMATTYKYVLYTGTTIDVGTADNPAVYLIVAEADGKKYALAAETQGTSGTGKTIGKCYVATVDATGNISVAADALTKCEWKVTAASGTTYYNLNGAFGGLNLDSGGALYGSNAGKMTIATSDGSKYSINRETNGARTVGFISSDKTWKMVENSTTTDTITFSFYKKTEVTGTTDPTPTTTTTYEISVTPKDDSAATTVKATTVNVPYDEEGNTVDLAGKVSVTVTKVVKDASGNETRTPLENGYTLDWSVDANDANLTKTEGSTFTINGEGTSAVTVKLATVDGKALTEDVSATVNVTTKKNVKVPVIGVVANNKEVTFTQAGDVFAPSTIDVTVSVGGEQLEKGQYTLEWTIASTDTSGTLTNENGTFKIQKEGDAILTATVKTVIVNGQQLDVTEAEPANVTVKFTPADCTHQWELVYAVGNCGDSSQTYTCKDKEDKEHTVAVGHALVRCKTCGIYQDVTYPNYHTWVISAENLAKPYPGYQYAECSTCHETVTRNDAGNPVNILDFHDAVEFASQKNHKLTDYESGIFKITSGDSNTRAQFNITFPVSEAAGGNISFDSNADNSDLGMKMNSSAKIAFTPHTDGYLRLMVYSDNEVATFRLKNTTTGEVKDYSVKWSEADKSSQKRYGYVEVPVVRDASYELTRTGSEFTLLYMECVENETAVGLVKTGEDDYGISKGGMAELVIGGNKGLENRLLTTKDPSKPSKLVLTPTVNYDRQSALTNFVVQWTVKDKDGNALKQTTGYQAGTVATYSVDSNGKLTIYGGDTEGSITATAELKKVAGQEFTNIKITVPVTVSLTEPQVKSYTLTDTTEEADYSFTTERGKEPNFTGVTLTLMYEDNTPGDDSDNPREIITVDDPDLVVKGYKYNEVGEYKLRILYKGQDITGLATTPFVLNVVPATATKPYPEYPQDGAVRIDKSAAGIDFLNTGVAQVELDVAGISTKTGVDVILVVDVSNSMGWSMDNSGNTGGDASKIPAVDNNYAPTDKTKLDNAMESAVAFADILLKGNSGKDDDNTLSFVTFSGYDKDNSYDKNGVQVDQEYSGNADHNTFMDLYKGTKYVDTTQTVFTSYTRPAAAKEQFEATKFIQLVKDRSGTGVRYVLQIGTAGEKDYANWDMKPENKKSDNFGVARGNTNYDYAFAQTEKAIQAVKNDYATAHEKTDGKNYDASGREIVVVFMTDGAASHYNGVSTSNNTNDRLPGEPTKGYTSFSSTGTDMAKQWGLELSKPNRYAQNLWELTDGFHVVGFDMDHGGFGEFTWEKAEVKAEDALANLVGAVPLEVTLASDANGLMKFYTDLANSLNYAGTNSMVNDVIGKDFTLQMSDTIQKSNGTTVKLDPAPAIDIKQYDLWLPSDNMTDENGKDLTGTRKTDAQGNVISKTIASVALGENGWKLTVYDESGKPSGEPITITDTGEGNTVKYVVQADGIHYFTYTKVTTQVTVNGKPETQETETFTWDVNTITDKEIALSYYVYLRDTAEGKRQSGLYDTNKSAILTYNDINGDYAEQTFPVPTLGWGKAVTQVEYYLVNAKGQPVNQNDVVVPFANRVTVSVSEAISMTWGETKTISGMTYRPGGYVMYNPLASYTVYASLTGDGKLDINDAKQTVDTEGKTTGNITTIRLDNSANTASTRVAIAVMKDQDNPYSGKDPAVSFPEYPQDGAVRLNKKASGEVYDFEKTGVARVELDVAGLSQRNGVDVILVVDVSNSMAWSTQNSGGGNDAARMPTAVLDKDGNPVTDGSGKTVMQTSKLEDAMDSAQAFAEILLGGDRNTNTLSFVTFAGYDAQLADSQQKYTYKEPSTSNAGNESMKRYGDTEYVDATQEVFLAKGLTEGDLENIIIPNFQATQFVESYEKIKIVEETSTDENGAPTTIKKLSSTGSMEYVLTIGKDGKAAYEKWDEDGTNANNTTKESLTVGNHNSFGVARGNTNYDYAFYQAKQTAQNIKTNYAGGEEAYLKSGRQIVVVFMTDGAASHYTFLEGGDADSITVTEDGQVTLPTDASWKSDRANGDKDDVIPGTTNVYPVYYNEVTDGTTGKKTKVNKYTADEWFQILNRPSKFATELFYTTGVGGMYTIGFDLDHGGFSDFKWTETQLVDTLSSLVVKQSVPVFATADSTQLKAFYQSLANTIKFAATHAMVTDVIKSEYTLQLSPTTAGTTAGSQISLVEDEKKAPEIVFTAYPLYTKYDTGIEQSEIGKRKSTGEQVLETVTWVNETTWKTTYTYVDENGQTQTVSNQEIQNSANANTQKGEVLRFEAHYFIYIKDTTGAEKFIWNIGNVDDKEYALSYFVYLKGALEGTAQEGIHPTNEEAILEYLDIYDRYAKRLFPVPYMPWGSGMTRLEFYLVNEYGQPVNYNGDQVPFANRIVVDYGKPVSVNWNETVKIHGAGSVPTGYRMFNPEAAYTVKAVKGVTTDKNLTFHYGDNDTVKTKGEYVNVDDHTTRLIFGAENNTEKTLVAVGVYQVDDLGDAPFVLDPVTVVIDFGKPMPIDANTVAQGKVPKDMVDNKAKYTVTMNGFYRYDSSVDVHDMQSGVGSSEFTLAGAATLKFENFTTESGMVKKVVFTPTNFLSEVERLFVTYKVEEKVEGTVSGQSSTKEYYLYQLVTVVPANVMYYETDFSDGAFAFSEKYTHAKTSKEYKWETVNDTTAVTDRSEYQDSYDASTEVYGYDSSYAKDNQYSNGSAWRVNGANVKLTYVTFSFTGTGFDLISQTGEEQGAIQIKVYDNAAMTGNPVKTLSVVNKSLNNLELYQIPVASIEMEKYGTYYVRIGVLGSSNVGALTWGQYFCFDGIRVYNPVDASDTTASKQYQTNNQCNPDIQEVRDILLKPSKLPNFNENQGMGLGAVFVDGANYTQGSWAGGMISGGTIAEYKDQGPKNEVYLSEGQGVAFAVNCGNSKPVSISIGAKSVDGNQVTMYASMGSTTYIQENGQVMHNTDKDKRTINTNTALFYSMNGMIPAAFAKDDNGDYIAYVLITNGDYKSAATAAENGTTVETNGILSITDIRIGFADGTVTTDSVNPAAVTTLAYTPLADEQPQDDVVYYIDQNVLEFAAYAMDMPVTVVDEPDVPDVPVEPVVPEPNYDILDASFEGTSGKYGRTGILTVVTTTDVESLTLVSDRSDKEVNTTATYTDVDGQRVWTVSFKLDALGYVTYTVTGCGLDGKVGASKAVTVKVTMF